MDTVTLRDISERVGGEIVGDPTVQCRGAHPLQDAVEGSVTLLDGAKRLEDLHQTQATAVVVESAIPECRISQLVVEDLHVAFCKIIKLFAPRAIEPICGLSTQAHIEPTAEIGSDTSVHAGVTIGANVKIGQRCILMPGTVVLQDVSIGDDCTLFPGVVLYERTIIDDRVTIHAGSILGAYGFGYRQEQGKHVRTAQLGHVHVEADVEIGAAVTIDRGTYGTTRIGYGTKIDNQVMIAHNCQIGRHNLLCSQVGIAGSCRTGDYVILAGQVGLKDHVTLGEGAIVAAQAGVMEDLDGGQVYLGSPATTQRNQMQIFAVQRRLPEMRRAIQQLTRKVDELNIAVEEGSETKLKTNDSNDLGETRAA